MPAYATQSDFEAYVEGWVTDDPAALVRLLERASRDIDNVMGPRPIRTTGSYAGYKLDPTLLQTFEAQALSRATCAQAEYLFRLEAARTEDATASEVNDGKGAVTREKGPDFEVQYAGKTSSAASIQSPGSGRYGLAVVGELQPIAHLRNLAGRATS